MSGIINGYSIINYIVTLVSCFMHPIIYNKLCACVSPNLSMVYPPFFWVKHTTVAMIKIIQFLGIYSYLINLHIVFERIQRDVVGKKYFIFCSHFNLNLFWGKIFSTSWPKKKTSSTTDAKKNYLKNEPKLWTFWRLVFWNCHL